jgi:hypothetical protein
MEHKTDNELIAEFMGFSLVSVGSKWDYNRQFDHSTNTHNLEVESINERGVKFIQKLAFERYSTDTFDGIIFKPCGWKSLNDNHYPARPYQTSWDWLMPVVEKIKNVSMITSVLVASQRRLVIDLPISSAIEIVYTETIKFIKWYNQQKK